LVRILGCASTQVNEPAGLLKCLAKLKNGHFATPGADLAEISIDLAMARQVAPD
jgi:hypothetical protein